MRRTLTSDFPEQQDTPHPRGCHRMALEARGGYLIYRCRMCGTDEHLSNPDVQLAMHQAHLVDAPGTPHTILHCCHGGQWGIADLIGGYQGPFDDRRGVWQETIA